MLLSVARAVDAILEASLAPGASKIALQMEDYLAIVVTQTSRLVKP